MGAVASEHLGDGCADAAGRAGHNGDLAVQRLLPVGRRCGIVRPDREDLAVDVGRLGRQQESHGRLEAGSCGLGVRRQVDQRRCRTAAQFLAQRAGEALQRALRDPLVRAGGRFGCAANNHHAPATAEIAQYRSKELVQPLEPGRLCDAGGVEDQPAERVRPAPAQVVSYQVVVLFECRAQWFDDPAGPADQQRPGQWRFACSIAAKRLGLRNTQLPGQKRSWTGVDNLREQIGRTLGSHFSCLPYRVGVGRANTRNRIED
ncbi:Uncharacterised protein [Mycobacterium tuberculosis]|nr:Uncharacterised protein [Mycobacterium tuberculosis]